MRTDLDGGFSGGRLGLIVLATYPTIETELRPVLAARPVTLVHARVPAEVHVTPRKPCRMQTAMGATAALLPSGLDVIGYACILAPPSSDPTGWPRHYGSRGRGGSVLPRPI